MLEEWLPQVSCDTSWGTIGFRVLLSGGLCDSVPLMAQESRSPGLKLNPAPSLSFCWDVSHLLDS